MMSFPNIPSISPIITVSRDEAINLLLASIAFEELGLAHIINAEGEKLQAGIGCHSTIHELIKLDKSVESTLKTVILKEILLQFQLEDVIDLIQCEEKKIPKVGHLTLTFCKTVCVHSKSAISGRVTDKEGNPVGGIMVNLLVSDGSVPSKISTATDGTFMVTFKAPHHPETVLLKATTNLLGATGEGLIKVI